MTEWATMTDDHESDGGPNRGRPGEETDMASANRNEYLDQVVRQQGNWRGEPAGQAPSRQSTRVRVDRWPKTLRGGGGAPVSRGVPAPARRWTYGVTGVRAVEDRPGAAERVCRAHPSRVRRTVARRTRGTSFRFNPSSDSYLVVPGAMQTILISAYCICSELQGVVVQAYVQWIIQDFATAYRKLDFSDTDDPMRLVNLQLKEQAEAAIKDKVATMSVHEVLSDKQPIVEDLIERLRGSGRG